MGIRLLEIWGPAAVSETCIAAPGQLFRRYNRGNAGTGFPEVFRGVDGAGRSCSASENRVFGDQQPLPNTTFAGKNELVVDGSQNLRGIGVVRTPFWSSGRRANGVRSEP